MKKRLIISLVLLITIKLFGISIYDIQYTNKAGNGTYPSPYNGKTVTTGGIVTGVNLHNGNTFFIESSSGGAWSGIYINDKNHLVSLGDSLIITGKVYDYFGPTEINNISSFQKVSSGNDLPSPVQISTNDVNIYEAYESVLVTVNNVTVTEEPIRFGNWKVDDGSGECTISKGFLDIVTKGYSVNLDDHFTSITGILNYSYNNHNLNPRNIKDLKTSPKSIFHNSYSEIGDTITIIQKPLLNIPFIGTTGSTIEILCKTDKYIRKWSASIQFEKFKYSLPIFNVKQYGNFYKLYATIPKTKFYELFDLIVSTGTETDRTENAVKIISDWKDSYYFIHITDSHLPTHIFYDDKGYKTDTSEIADLREVIKDINLLNPEFVLFTGDIVNEGEFEDFQNRRYYTKSQKLLAEFDVPVFVTSGNHDLSGSKKTPPIQGISRRNWWKFYGWKWLENTTSFYPYHTQNYHFKYGSQNFIGLEAYDNHDKFMLNIYGNESFTNDQLKYLNSTLNNIPKYEKKILFFHYDFSHQIDLAELGVDMALIGHIHTNWGDINEYPYFLVTAATCDEIRAYRVIKVKSNRLYPKETINAGFGGKKLNIIYSPSNRGVANLVTATIENRHPISFENILIKFKMPKSYDYHIKNGKLKQIVEYKYFNICYVKANLSASNTTSISISVK
ncbi:MAG: metallophosphoesterase [Candidatus Marinimicrobia bacterium]|nr:metallophosphoesterase [Candidatus Neomarinimicrobiota bacterium]